MSTVSFAEGETPNATNGSENVQMTIDVFLEQFESMVPQEVCNGFKSDSEIWPIMEKKNVTLEKCTELTKTLTIECVNKYKDKLPKEFDNDVVSAWTKKVGYCIGLEFATKYIYNEDYKNEAAESKTSNEEPAMPIETKGEMKKDDGAQTE